MSNNQELMNWALENLSEDDWGKKWTHLRSDSSRVPVFFTSGESWNIVCSGWRCWNDSYIKIGSSFTTDSPQVISRKEFLQKLKEENVMSELFGKKYRVNPETSKLLQEAMFDGGGRWTGTTDTDVSYRGDTFIFVDDSGRMSSDDDYDWFLHSSLPEAKIEVIKSIKIHPVESEEDKRKKSIQQKIEEHQASLNNLKEELEKL